jgi:hypothetical protein
MDELPTYHKTPNLEDQELLTLGSPSCREAAVTMAIEHFLSIFWIILALPFSGNPRSVHFSRNVVLSELPYNDKAITLEMDLSSDKNTTLMYEEPVGDILLKSLHDIGKYERTVAGISEDNI